MQSKRKLCFNWGISDHFGWGVYGLNLLTYGQMSKTFQVIPVEVPSFLYPLDPLTVKYLSEKLPSPNTDIELLGNDIFLSALGNSNLPTIDNRYRNVGVIFSETNPLPPNEILNLKKFDFIIAGSSWNSSVLIDKQINAYTVMQGIDLDLFQPAPKKYLKDKFVIFSGGKLEYRKGQDILLKAFAKLASKYKDVVLITAWRSPWESQFAASINKSSICEPLQISTDMGKSIYEWILLNGVQSEQIICLDAIPNRLMPDVFREVDLAVFTNRCEGGTNLVAMEALAYGLPCLISKNTGHLDIIKSNNCFPLTLQKQIHGDGMRDWGESSVDEIVDLMEDQYLGRTKIDRLKVRESMLNYSWERAINSMLSLF
ncbi:RfaG Glycosyltransferase [Burkholderiaceae bacterium]|jgi:glycosyltransferase involved in cell wall biosynthesis